MLPTRILSCTLLFFISSSLQQVQAVSTENLLTLSLSDLMNIEVTSAGKKTQELSHVAAAIFVIDAEDLKRSGVTSIPDALRMVPGLHVSQFNNRSWGVSARGGYDAYSSERVLVMIDGRTVYIREFSSTLWDQIHLVLEDIDRIEVIRGPGGTLWGANAVNGVINIITKSAQDTQGGLFKLIKGSEIDYQTSVRYGGQIGDNNHYRVFMQARGQKTADIEIDDKWRAMQTGFRIDSNLSAWDTLTLQGDYSQGWHREVEVTNYQAVDGSYRSGNLLGRWTHNLNDDNQWQVQGYYDSYHRNFGVVKSKTQTFDLDIQNRFKSYVAHEVVWGFGARYIRQASEDGSNLRFIPSQYSESLFNIFLQDEITLSPDAWFLTIGAKLEYMEEIGTEIQPSVRLLWTPNTRRSLWAAWSRAIHVPSWVIARGETKGEAAPTRNPFYPLRTYWHIKPSGLVEIERLTSYELGWKEMLREGLFLDATLFYSQHRNAFTENSFFVARDDGFEYVAISGSSEHVIDGHGLELSLDWQTNQSLRWQFVYTYFDMDNIFRYPNPIPSLNRFEPTHSISLRTHWQFAPRWSLDTWIRYSDKIEDTSIAILDESPIKEYTTMDARLAWQAHKNVTFSVVGRNLLKPQHDEYRLMETIVPYTPVERSVYGQVEWRF